MSSREAGRSSRWVLSFSFSCKGYVDDASEPRWHVGRAAHIYDLAWFGRYHHHHSGVRLEKNYIIPASHLVLLQAHLHSTPSLHHYHHSEYMYTQILILSHFRMGLDLFATR